MLREFAALSIVCCASARLLLSVASVTQAVVKSAIIVSRVFCAVNSLASQVSRAARDRLWFLPNKSSSKLETAPSACEAELRPLATVLLAGVAQFGINGGKQRCPRFAILGARGLDIGQRLLHIAVAVQRDADHFFQPRVIDHFLPVADHRRRFAVRPGQGGRHRRGRAIIMRVKRDAARGQERDKHKNLNETYLTPEKDVGG